MVILGYPKEHGSHPLIAALEFAQLHDCADTSWRITGADLALWRKSHPGSHFYGRPGWSQHHAAHWAGIHHSEWSRWETGARGIPKSLVRRLIEYELYVRPQMRDNHEPNQTP